ncbi:MAG: CaiB/BaiF CoA transferase family protein [Acidimicrobiales bacterium]
MNLPYQNLRVLELAHDPGGEMLGRQLVGLGADVAKIEPPGGVPSRRMGPVAGDHDDPDHHLAYWYYNGGKASVVLDLHEPDERADFERLASEADICISTMHPLELDALEIDWHRVAEENGRLIAVSLTPFGLEGPWAQRRSSDLVGLATSGLLITSGYDDHSIPPIRPGGDQAYHTAASFGHIATGLALIQRELTGAGAVIDVSMHEAAGLTVELANPYWFYPKGLVKRQTCRHAQPVATAPALFECQGGQYVYFALILADPKPWKALIDWMDEHGMATDLSEPAYDSLEHRQANFGHIQEVVEVFFLLQDATAAYHEGQARGLPIGILNAPEDLIRDDHLRERGFFVEVNQPDAPGTLQPGVPFTFSHLETAPPTPAARLGADTDRYRTNGWS